MALGFNNSPVNWNIDYGQLRSGEYMGNALANTGGILSNAIFKAAEAQEKRRKEKELMRLQKEEEQKEVEGFVEIARRLGVNIDTSNAKGVYKAIGGGPGLMQLAQTEQRTKQAEQQAQQAIWERNSLIQSALKSYHPQGGPASIMPAGGVTGNAQFPGGQFDQNMFLRDAITKGAPIGDAIKAATGISSLQPKKSFEPEVKTVNGVRMARTSDGQYQVLTEPKAEKERETQLAALVRERDEYAKQGRTDVVQQYNRAIQNYGVQPDIWGNVPGAQAPAQQADATKGSEKYKTAEDVIDEFRAGKIKADEARRIIKERGWQ